MSKVLFIDIETVPQTKGQTQPEQAKLFKKRFVKEIENLLIPSIGLTIETIDKFWDEKASLYAEFGKVVAISMGMLTATKFNVKTVVGRDEKVILRLLHQSIENSKCDYVCAHNGKEFDFPFLMRRYIINGMPIPPILNVAGLKPWETKFEDTMQMWSGSAWNYKVSLDLLAYCLGIPSPKKNMDGSMVADLYYGMFKDLQDDQLPFDAEETALRKIGSYCAGDVVTLYKCYCRIKGMEMVKDENIVMV